MHPTKRCGVSHHVDLGDLATCDRKPGDIAQPSIRSHDDSNCAVHAQLHLPVIIDPANLADYSHYRGATCIKLNRTETIKATGLPAQSAEHFETAAARLLDERKASTSSCRMPASVSAIGRM